MTILTISLDKHASLPMYQQIANQIAHQVEQGTLQAQDKLPTHRALAEQLQVTVGTITRAYAEAERLGVVEARVGAGTYIVDPQRDLWKFHQAGIDDYAPAQCNLGYNIPPANRNNEYALAQAMRTLASHADVMHQLMMYQQPGGVEAHRHRVADWLTTQGKPLDGQRLLFSSGVQHGIQLVIDSLTQTGDTLLVEKLTYPGLFSLASQKHLTIKGVDMDEHGMIPAALAAACRQFQAKLVYLTPTLQNPTTVIMPEARRQAILDVCQQYGLIVIEDDVCGLLCANAPTPLVHLAPDRVIHIGSFSKCLSPGLRVGYLQPPQRLYPQLKMALQNHSWMTSPLLTGLICELIRTGELNNILLANRQEMAERATIARQYLHDFQIAYQQDGYHLWLTLPEYWRLSDFVAAAEGHHIIVKSAEQFTPPAGHIVPAVRLSLSSPLNQAQLIAGLTQLQQLLRTPPLTGFDL